MPSPAIPTFGCIQRAGSEEPLIVFNDRTSFRAIASKGDLDQLCMAFPIVVLLGVFDWSNYSHDVFRDMVTDALWFSQHSVGVGVMCLGNPDQLKEMSEDAHANFMTLNTEPVVFCFFNSMFAGVLAGPRSAADIKHWILQQSNGLRVSRAAQQADEADRNMSGESSSA